VALPLEPLNDEQARELASRLLARAAGEPAGQAAEDIGRAAEGNPLFIEELVASVVERSSSTDEELPTSIRGIISSRLDAIPPQERAVLLDASVVGRIFWDGALAHLRADSKALPELLDSLEGRDL